MRVISGTKRGLKLESLDGLDTRPTLDRVKESIFSMIFDMPYDAKVLDLFAGSGGMGIEALSRGSRSAVFVDKSAQACAVVRNNIRKSGFEDKSAVVNTDSADYIQKASHSGEAFDIIFLDPPYGPDILTETLAQIHKAGILAEGGVIVVESDNGTDVDIQNYKLLKDKRYGRVCINLLGAQ